MTSITVRLGTERLKELGHDIYNGKAWNRQIEGIRS